METQCICTIAAKGSYLRDDAQFVSMEHYLRPQSLMAQTFSSIGQSPAAVCADLEIARAPGSAPCPKVINDKQARIVEQNRHRNH